MKKFLIYSLISMLSLGAHAAVNVNNGNANANAQMDWKNDAGYQEAQEIAILENDIRILDEEIAKCQKKKKAWTAATIVGGVGVVATGVGAIVQANKNSDKKAKLSDKEQQLKDLKNQKQALQ